MSSIWATIKRIIKFMFSREVIVYFIAGVLATLVNVGVFALLTKVFGADRWWASNLPAIAAAMLFAFFSNRIVVFRSHGPFFQELWKFFSSRILVSLLFEYGAMYLIYNLIGFTAAFHFSPGDEGLLYAKLITQVLVMVGNYVFSKLFIFTHKPAAGEQT